MEIRRFGTGHRRTDPPRGAKRVEAQVLHRADGTAVVELYFRSSAELLSHEAPHPILFIVTHGSGFVRVGTEERPVTAGNAVLWPPHVSHGARTGRTDMGAIAVEMMNERTAAPEEPAAAQPQLLE